MLQCGRGACVAAGRRRDGMSKVGSSDSKNTLYCSFCGKSQHEVRKLIAGPQSFICDECVDICIDIIEPDDDLELFRLMKANGESEVTAYPALLELARGTSTEELARYVERSRKGVERNRVALQAIEHRRRDGADDNVLAAMRQRHNAS